MAKARGTASAMRDRAVDVTVFPNGVIPRGYLCQIPWAPSHWLDCAAAADLVILDARWRIDHGSGHIPFTDSYRTLDGQYDCQAAKGSMCATPGTSNHGWGRAVDFAGGIEIYGSQAHEWMQANAPDLGWTNPQWARPWGSKPEPWHWEHAGAS